MVFISKKIDFKRLQFFSLISGDSDFRSFYNLLLFLIIVYALT